MKSVATIYAHARGDATRFVHPHNQFGDVLAGVQVGPVSIMSTDPDHLEQLAAELTVAAAEQRSRTEDTEAVTA